MTIKAAKYLTIKANLETGSWDTEKALKRYEEENINNKNHEQPMTARHLLEELQSYFQFGQIDDDTIVKIDTGNGPKIFTESVTFGSYKLYE